MNILLTNDDGYRADGLTALARSLGRYHRTCILAPDRERSAQSHAMTLRDPLTIIRHEDNYYSCSGTPADCVILAGHGAIPFKPDLVVSGINRGPNLGTDLIYSGTAAAARQAVMNGWPGLAVSLASFSAPFHYSSLADFVADKLESLAASLLDGCFLNINAPSAPDGHVYAVYHTDLSKRVYEDTLRTIDTSGNHYYCLYTDGRVSSRHQEGSDAWAVNLGALSISQVEVYPRACLPQTGG